LTLNFKFNSPFKSTESFSVYPTLEKFENAKITSHFGFFFEENTARGGKLHGYRNIFVLKKLRF